MNSAELLPSTAGGSSVLMKAGKPMGRRRVRSSAAFLAGALPVWRGKCLFFLLLSPIVLTSCAGRSPAPVADAPAVQEFPSQILKHQNARQSGRTINLLVRYRYRAGLDPAAYPDDRDLYRAALQYLPVWPEQPLTEYREVLSEGLVREPGFHSSLVTIGSVSPISFAGMAESP